MIGELHQRDDGRGDPDFGVIGFEKFQRGEGDDAIADAAGTDEQTAGYSITTGSLTSTVDGRKHMSLPQAW